MPHGSSVIRRPASSRSSAPSRRAARGRGCPSAVTKSRRVDLDLALLEVPVGPHRHVPAHRAVGRVDVERRRQPEHLPDLGDPRADRDDDLLDRDVARARAHARHRPGAVELEAEHLDALGDPGARGARLARQPEHRLAVEREAAGVLVQADREPGRPPVGIERAHVLADRALADARAPTGSRSAAGARAPRRGRPPGPAARARCSPSRGSAASRGPTPRSPRRRPSAPAWPAGSSCCARRRTRCPTRRRATPVLSTTSTSSPERARCQAVESPWTPAPTTRKRTDEGSWSGAWRGSLLRLYQFAQSPRYSRGGMPRGGGLAGPRRGGLKDERRRQRQRRARSCPDVRRHGRHRHGEPSHRARAGDARGGPQRSPAAASGSRRSRAGSSPRASSTSSSSRSRSPAA